MASSATTALSQATVQIDDASARRFARYWWLIRPASGAIRRSWLVAIKRRAERHPDGHANSQ